MSAPQNTRYSVHHIVERNGLKSFELFELQGSHIPVDYFRSLAGAEHAANMLNNGWARVNPHACVGCRVEIQR